METAIACIKPSRAFRSLSLSTTRLSYTKIQKRLNVLPLNVFRRKNFAGTRRGLVIGV